MSVTAPEAGASGRPLLEERAVVALLALLLAGGLMMALGALLSAGAPPPPPPRTPFGITPREAAPAAGGLGAFILAWQSSFYRELTAALRSLKDSGAALPALIWLGFAYGAFHAAGPGHGKAVISAYILSEERSQALRAFALSLSAALVQAAVAIGLVLVLRLILNVTARQMTDATRVIELASFATVALVGLVLLWLKAGVFVAARRGEEAACAPGCAHDVAALPPQRSFGRTASVVVAAGLRPCAGALIVLVFALAQGLFWAGVAATLAMALGVALTTGALALLAVVAKRAALGLAGGRGQRAALAIRGLECLAAAFLAALGALLLFGLWTSGAS